MPSHRDLQDLDAIAQYFANRTPGELERDEAEAMPPISAEAIDRPPLRRPCVPAQSLSQRPSSGEEAVDDLMVWVAKLVDQRIEQALSHLEQTQTRGVISRRQKVGGGALSKGRRRAPLKGGQNKLPATTVDVPLENRSGTETVKYVN